MYLKLLVAVVSVKVVLLSLAVFEELGSNLLEERVGENVLLLLHVLSTLSAELVELGSKLVSGTASDRLVVTDDELSEFVRYGSGTCTVVAANHTLELLGYHLVALAADYVENCLSTNDLGRRCYKRGIARIFAYAGNFCKNLIKLFRLTCLLKLRNEV